MANKKSDKEIAREYRQIRRELWELLNYRKPELVEGPARILALIWKPDRTYDFEFIALSPGEEFEGKCLVWDIGIYD